MENPQDISLDIVEKNKNVVVERVKSRAVVKYSAVHLPTDFARLQCNTNLNLPPSNWLTSYAESYGLHHTLAGSTGFSSFRMAHMFPDSITEVDVVSDAENIKKLLKIPYSRNTVSMMVHCLEKTLLIDEFDIHKHLLRTSESDWEWLRKFFFEHVLQTLSQKNLSVSAKNSRHALQERSLVSKFLHYSLTESDQDGKLPAEQPADRYNDLLAETWPPLPEPKIDEQLPDSSTKQTFNRNVVWTFEDIQMLLGTNLPIFGGTTHPCISLRLRDTNKPISVLTGIDYWLDNLMCNVPEVVMCYHLDGIVQRYELIKTEDLPHLPNSKFSPNLIRGVAQNILSFLKSNATKAGHTYWLFKGKDEDVVKLYDLTSLCSESLVEQGQNPFTVPVAMLLYRVARNMKHSSEPSSMRPGTIRALLDNCLVLLHREKYPQIVTSAHYMLSDLYLPLGVDPDSLCDEQEVSDCPEPTHPDTSLIHTLSISDDLDPLPLPPYEPPPPLMGSVAERCQQALQHVVSGLQCLQFFDTASPHDQSKDEKCDERTESEVYTEPKMAHPHQPIPMPYSSLTPEKLKEDTCGEEAGETSVVNNKKKTKHKKKKNSEKQKKRQSEILSNHISKKVSNSLEEFPMYSRDSAETALLQKLQLPTWQAPNPSDTESWKGHLKTLLYEKACLVYNTMADSELSAKRFGAALRCVSLALRSHAHMAAGCGRCTSLVSGVLSLAGDCCFHLAQEWQMIDGHRADYASFNDTDNALLTEMEHDMIDGDYPFECELLPQKLESAEHMLISSLGCYQQAQKLKPCDALHSRIGNVHNELSTFYMDKLNAMIARSVGNLATVKTEVHMLLSLSEQHLTHGLREFTELGDKYNTALLFTNTGRLMRMNAIYLSNFHSDSHKVQQTYCDKALELYDKGLEVLGGRKGGPKIWDIIQWEKSSTMYTMATSYQDNPPSISEKSQEEVEREMLELFTRALQSCNLEFGGSRQCIYQYRAATLHGRLASLYHHMYRKKQDDSKRKHLLHLANLHFEKSATLMEQLEHPTDFLRLQMERVALQEFVSENSGQGGKLKALQTGLEYLLKCKPVLDYLAEQADGPKDPEKIVDTSEVEEQKSLLTMYEARIQFIMKNLVKFTISSSNPKVSCLAKNYKDMYSQVLKREPGVTLAAHLSSLASSLEPPTS